MAARFWLKVALVAVTLAAHGAFAQDQALNLTPAGKAMLGRISGDGRQVIGLFVPDKSAAFPLPTCMFPGGLCGAVRRDGTIAVPPRYDWVGAFFDGRAAVRVGGLYGFVDDEGREVVKPQYRIVDDYKYGFAQVDVDGKSGLIDRDGKMVVEPKYGSIVAVGSDRFRVSERRRLGGMRGAEDFSGTRTEYTASGGISFSGSYLETKDPAAGIIDISGQWIEPPDTTQSLEYDKDDPSIRRMQKDGLWGLARADGSWLVEPRFQQIDSLTGGLARATVGAKVGFVDRTGHFAIPPVFDQAWRFKPGFALTSAQRDGIFGVIDNTGAWVFQTNYQQIHFAVSYSNKSETVFGWHFKKADRWGLLDLGGRVVLDADFDQSIQRCADGRLVGYRNKEWLYFKGDGSPLQPPDGRLINASCGGVPPYTLKIGDKFGLVDASSGLVTPVHFDAIVRAGAGVWNVQIDGKWGRVGPDGNWLLEPKFDYLSAGLNIFVASIDSKRGFMRPDGSWLIEPKFEAARLRDDDTAFVRIAGATGVLRLSDRSWAVSPRPDVMCDIGNAIMTEADGKRVILSRSGETWIDIGAERVGINLDLGLLTFLKNSKWGLVDTAGQVIAEPQFDEPVYFASVLRGIAWAKRDGNWCAIDRRGRSVTDIPCVEADPMHWPGGRFECKVEP
jgi:WG containing repeat